MSEKSTKREPQATTRQAFIIGTDEAGYGPNLGPLVVGASCWRTSVDVGAFAGSDATSRRAFSQIASQPTELKRLNESPSKSKATRRKRKTAEIASATLFDLTPDEPSNEPSQDAPLSAPRIDGADATAFVPDVSPITNGVVERLNDSLAELCDRRGAFPILDSKKLYGPSKSLAALERSFLLAFLLTDREKRKSFAEARFRTVLAKVANETSTDAQTVPPWEVGVDFSLPLDPKTGSFESFDESLNSVVSTFASNGVALVDVSARRVQPFEFNRLLDELGLKSDLIAEVTTTLAVETLARSLTVPTVDRLLNDVVGTPIAIILCDKLGGRDRYESLLKRRFPDAAIQVVAESRAASVYRLVAKNAVARRNRRLDFPSEVFVEIRFTAKGESNLPTALASICAKCLRELSMKPFNDFWRRATSNPDLKPTAGYPLDAKRFRAEIDATRRRLAIPDAVFWRAK